MEFPRFGNLRPRGAARPKRGQSRLERFHPDLGRLPLSTLQSLLQGQEVPQAPHHDRVWESAQAQVSLLPALQQVQGEHIEARHAHPSEPSVSVANKRPRGGESSAG
ncbi:hypothetical protein KM043_007678 [Ampulex compressa]|nr:hypothetical protein KM043_007678 [Ampulex compressa]